jgi:hypothetical protein
VRGGKYVRNLFFRFQGDPMKTAELVMLRSWRKPAKLFSDFNTLQFAGVMSLVMLVLLMVSWCRPSRFTRDGKVYFGVEQVRADALPQKIADRLKDHNVERKVYIKADTRARWGAVKDVVDGVRAAGLMRVAFLVDQRRSAALHL